jgi:hypothetical protein
MILIQEIFQALIKNWNSKWPIKIWLIKFQLIYWEMLKLYKKIDGQLHYWETWETDNKSSVVHWGVVGDRGKQLMIGEKQHPNYTQLVEEAIQQRLREGYLELDDEQLIFLDVVFTIDGFGSAEDLDKRERLEKRLNETLGWVGLGHVDGGSIGSGSMEVGCIVVDFEIAKNIIEKDLQNTEFGDYSQIYQLD